MSTNNLERGILTGALWLTRHWQAAAGVLLALFAALPLAAPILMARGYTTPASLIYRAYRLTCHQEPHRSFFIGGPRLTHTRDEIEAVTETRPLASFLGSPDLGYKVAYCQRDMATYTAMLLAGLVCAIAGRRLARLPLVAFAVMLMPVAADGLTQLIGLRESTWLLRSATGALFGVAIAWLLYHPLDEVMSQAAQDFAARLARY